VTFLGLLTLAKEQLVEIIQDNVDDHARQREHGPAPIYVKSLALMKDADEIELSSEFDADAANDAGR
jgi:segregation and condensation protein A